MKRSRMKFIFASIILSLVVVLVCVVIGKVGSGNSLFSNDFRRNTVETNADVEFNSKKYSPNLTFFVSDKNIVKSKTKVGETTMLQLNVKMIITNTTQNDCSIVVDGFSCDYDINKYATFFSFDCESEENNVIVETNNVKCLDFTVKYVVKDVVNFVDYEKYELKFSYLDNEIIKVSI